jgi:tetratricopeptide (TPR) repeat protein
MDDRLAAFVARQHDRIVAEGQPGLSPCLDDNDWALLVDDLLSPRQREAIIEHISRCPACRRQASQIVSEFKSDAGARPQIIRYLQFGAYAAAAGLIVAVAMYIGYGGSSARQTRAFALAEQQIARHAYAEARHTLDPFLAAGQLAPDRHAHARTLYEQSYVAQAQSQLDRNRYVDAQAVLTEAMDRGYDSADIKRLCGRAIMGTALAFASPEEETLTGRGMAGVLRRRTKDLPAPATLAAEFQTALDLLEQVVAEQPASPAGWRDLGLAKLAARRFDEAAEALDRRAQIEPGSADARNACGMALYGAGRYADAAAAFQEAIGIAPNVGAYELNAAIACEEAGELAAAVGHWQRYLVLKPTGKDAEEAQRWLPILQKGLVP